MSAKEINALVDIGITMGYSGDELKQFVHDERMRIDKEQEAERQRKEQEASELHEMEENERRRKFELEKLT